MSHELESIRVNCLLYLDDFIQAELADYVGDLTKFRRGEVLRSILVKGWLQYKEDMGIGLDDDEIVNLLQERNKKIKNNKKPHKKNKSVTPKENKNVAKTSNLKENEIKDKENEEENKVDNETKSESESESNSVIEEKEENGDDSNNKELVKDDNEGSKEKENRSRDPFKNLKL